MQYIDSVTDFINAALDSLKDFLVECRDRLKAPFARRKGIICPFCFNEIALQEVMLRCTYAACPGKVLDTTYATERGIPATVMGRTWVPFVINPQLLEDECRACERKSSTPICPRCHYELPSEIGQIDQRIIAIIGGSNTGKSHYIPVLIERLKEVIGSEFGFTVHTYGDETRRRYEQEFFIPLYKNRTVIQKTLPSEIDSGVMAPLIFRLTFSRGKSKRTMSLYFFDTAGEDMKSVQTLTHQNRYIVNAHGIIFLLDPLQIEKVRQQLPNTNQPDADRQAAPDYIVDRLKELFDTHSRQVGNRVKIPVAFTLSKVDTLSSLVEPSSVLRRPSEHPGGLDLADIQAMSTEIESDLDKWISPNFCEKIRDSFPNSCYFGISSLGRQPGPGNRVDVVRPFRVEDPFLWILYRFGLIDVKKKGR